MRGLLKFFIRTSAFINKEIREVVASRGSC